jgi:uncharacterized cupin superfamily protein
VRKDGAAWEIKDMSASDNAQQHVIKPISVESVSWETWSEGTRFGSRVKHLTNAAGVANRHVGFVIEELAPGQQSCPAHYHMLEEEHVYMLAGSVTLRLGEERYVLKEGDYACFPAGQKAEHCLINQGDGVCRYIVVGERNPNEVCVYPDSNKVSVSALGRGAIFDKAATRDYWDGENKDAPLSGQKP